MSTPSPHTDRPGAPAAAPGMERIEQLVRSLRGVISVRAVPDGDGDVDKLHVLAADTVGREELVREIESALLTYFDVALEPDQTSVVISHDPDFLTGDDEAESAESADSGPAGPGNGASASAPPDADRWPEPASGVPETPGRFEVDSPGPRGRGSAGDRFPEPAETPAPFEDTARRAEHQPDDRERTGTRRPSRRRRERRREPRTEARPGPESEPHRDPVPRSLRLVRFTAEGDAGPGVEIRVTLEIDGQRYDGIAHADGLDGLEPIQFAEAAAHAAEIGLRSTARPDDVRTAVRVDAVERLELFGRPHVAVSLETRGRGGRRSVTGFHPDADGPSRAAALAVLDGVRRALDAS